MSRMERQYQLMYRMGVTPWATGKPARAVGEYLDGGTACAPGIALDIGCGTGESAIYLSRRGWHVIGIDVSRRAIAAAKMAAPEIDWRAVDLIDASLEEYTSMVNLIIDIGCLHGLNRVGRESWGRLVNRVSTTAAVVLVQAAPPSRALLRPAGISMDDVAETLGPSWHGQTRDHHVYTFERHQPNVAV